jgi:hypothetical protein
LNQQASVGFVDELDMLDGAGDGPVVLAAAHTVEETVVEDVIVMVVVAAAGLDKPVAEVNNGADASAACL